MDLKIPCILLIIGTILITGCIQYVPNDQMPPTQSFPVENKTNVTVPTKIAHAEPTLPKPSIYGFVPPT